MQMKRPADIDAMKLRDFLAAAEAFTTAGGGMSEAERDELWEWIQASPTTDTSRSS